MGGMTRHCPTQKKWMTCQTFSGDSMGLISPQKMKSPESEVAKGQTSFSSKTARGVLSLELARCTFHAQSHPAQRTHGNRNAWSDLHTMANSGSRNPSWSLRTDDPRVCLVLPMFQGSEGSSRLRLDRVQQSSWMVHEWFMNVHET